jgi:hypothetical protein
MGTQAAVASRVSHSCPHPLHRPPPQHLAEPSWPRATFPPLRRAPFFVVLSPSSQRTCRSPPRAPGVHSRGSQTTSFLRADPVLRQGPSLVPSPSVPASDRGSDRSLPRSPRFTQTSTRATGILVSPNIRRFTDGGAMRPTPESPAITWGASTACSRVHLRVGRAPRPD